MSDESNDHGRAGLSEDEREAIGKIIGSHFLPLYPLVESLLASRMADAWDEGQQAGFRFYREQVPFAERDRNPYREDA